MSVRLDWPLDFSLREIGLVVEDDNYIVAPNWVSAAIKRAKAVPTSKPETLSVVETKPKGSRYDCNNVMAVNKVAIA